ncbi:hypothetical protein IMY05_001G0081100 [Salix suchowensis]|nr:hypothetical protein IMY05_001G0081100 [Salix suchowensis]
MYLSKIMLGSQLATSGYLAYKLLLLPPYKSPICSSIFRTQELRLSKSPLPKPVWSASSGLHAPWMKVGLAFFYSEQKVVNEILWKRRKSLLVLTYCLSGLRGYPSQQKQFLSVYKPSFRLRSFR